MFEGPKYFKINSIKDDEKRFEISISNNHFQWNWVLTKEKKDVLIIAKALVKIGVKLMIRDSSDDLWIKRFYNSIGRKSHLKKSIRFKGDYIKNKHY